MIFSYPYRFVPGSAIIREASSCSRRELAQTLTTGQSAKTKRFLKDSILNGISSNPYLQDSEYYVEEEVKR